MKLLKGGAVFTKVQMTKIWKDDKFLPVTLLKMLDNTIIRHKNIESDGYIAIVVGVGSYKKGDKVLYKKILEYRLGGEELLSNFPIESKIDFSSFADINTIGLSSITKGKGFQGPIKRTGAHGMPATHGHKFTRVMGSMGNRKPRRTMKGHPGSGQMGNELMSIRSVNIVDKFHIDGHDYIAVKGPIPGWKNTFVKLYFN